MLRKAIDESQAQGIGHINKDQGNITVYFCKGQCRRAEIATSTSGLRATSRKLLFRRDASA